MAINFPDNPTSNQIYSEVNKSWKWNGTAWIGIASTGPQGPQGPQGVDGAGVAYSTSFNGPHDITESRNTGNAGNSLGPVTVDTGLSYIVGDLIIVSGDPSPGNFQTAQVTSYDSATGVMEWNHLQASTIYSNSQNWNINLTGAPGNDGADADTGGVGTSVTGTATFTNSTNNIALTGIGSITGLADGDVIEVTGSVSNDDVYTVEGITDTGNVIVNAEHAGGTTSKSLTDETVAVTVTLVCKAKNAPLGYGQGWVAVTRSANSDITNSTGRLIAVGASATNSRATYVVCSGYVDGLAITNFRNDDLNNYDRELFAYFNVTDGSIYKVETIGCDLQTWSELR